jgi:predicted ferric reductase
LSTIKILPPPIRYLSAACLILFIVFLIVGALAIPFLYESSSMWYKFGIAKTSLRIGKMLGLVAGLLILLQLPLAGRIKWLDRIFSLPGLIRQHRRHAWVIVLMALGHPACILLSEDMLLIPLEVRYWPEWLGLVLLGLIMIQMIGSQWRQALRIPFHVWLPLHRIAGMMIPALVIVHVLYVSESFTTPGVPRSAVFIAAVIFFMIWMWMRTGWLRAGRRPYVVSRVEPAGTDCTSVFLTPVSRIHFSYMPGQFAIVSFRSKRISAEPHAFSLCSTPSQGETLQFTILRCGDWTRKVTQLQPLDKTLIQGPFGRFGHLFTTAGRELIMIAGGIGITPMLSMLRFMADHGDERSITLIWSNRSERGLIFADELDAMSAKLTGFRFILIFTRKRDRRELSGRLNQSMLKDLLRDCSPEAAVFVCGPPAMMRQVITDLKALGFPAGSIFTENFDF